MDCKININNLNLDNIYLINLVMSLKITYINNSNNNRCKVLNYTRIIIKQLTSNNNSMELIQRISFRIRIPEKITIAKMRIYFQDYKIRMNNRNEII
jgi:hypothetical protein